MNKNLPAILFLFAFASHFSLLAQNFSNKGKDFWTNFYRGNGNFSGGIRHDMKIYIGGASTSDSVTIAIGEDTPNEWKRTYWVPANSIVASDTLPNRNIISDTVYRKSAIHITSRTANIVAYAHLYEGATSAAAMLLPSTVWGKQYFVLTSRQNYSTNNYSAFQVVAKEDSTWVEISPSKPTLRGWLPGGGTQPNGSYLVKLNKGDCYQVLGALISGSEGHDLSGSYVKSIPKAQGKARPIAVFCGSTRTSISCSSSIGSSGDVLYQQAIPTERWGTKYLTAPTNNSTGPNSLSRMTNIYRIMVNDPATIVYRNGNLLDTFGLINDRYYQYESNTADYIVANKPVMVAQFMSSQSACPNTSGNGDPEMFYLSPLEQAITKTVFYRNDVEAIDDNFVTLILPFTALNSLKIDGIKYSAIPATSKYDYNHPNLPGYTVVTKRWTAAPAQCIIESSAGFTGITYGLGLVESYGYNIGAHFDSINLQSIQYNTILGSMFLDRNRNAVKDVGEPPFILASVISSKGTDTTTTITSTGSFAIYTDTGSYKTSTIPYMPYYNVVPFFHNSSFFNYGNTDTISFAMQPIAGIRDLEVTVVPLGPARPGFNAYYKIIFQNKGTDTVTSGYMQLVKDSKTTFLASNPVQNAIISDTIKWNFTNLLPLESRTIWLTLIIAPPPSVTMGTQLCFGAEIFPKQTDVYLRDNKISLCQTVVGSYDPNDKTENHAGKMRICEINNGEYLTYTIRFQNTGNDTAFNVQIKDTMESKVDWNSLEMLSSSHHYQMTMEDGKCLWSFNNIKLVDINTNEQLSHGFLVFRVRVKQPVVPNDIIANKAFIYFDFNFPVITNTERTTIVADIVPLKLLSFIAKKLEKTNLLLWTTAAEENVSHFEIERSSNGREFSKIGAVKAGQTQYSFTDDFSSPSLLERGGVRFYYRLKMLDKDGQFTYSPIRSLTINHSSLTITLFPNPAKDNLQVQIDSDKPTTLQMQVLSLDGKVLLSNGFSAAEGSSLRSINIGALQKGSYFLKVISADKEDQVVKFEKL